MLFFKSKFVQALACACMFCLLASGMAFAAAQQDKGIQLLTPDGMMDLITKEGAGKVVIISVFASWCPPCKEEMPLLVKLRNSFSEEKLMIAGVSTDESMRDLNKFVQDFKLNFPVYSGTMPLLQRMRIGSIPHTFIFNKKGELVESIVGLVPELQFRLIIAKLMSE